MAAAADRTVDFFHEECDNAGYTTQDRIEELEALIEEAQISINRLENEQ